MDKDNLSKTTLTRYQNIKTVMAERIIQTRPFSTDMSIAELYKRLCIPWCEQQYIFHLKQSLYRKIIYSKYNIGFKIPKSDTYKTCDETNIKLESAIQTNNNQESTILYTTVDLHKARAKEM